jgi:outer membrane protein OmpA-like peptidoglycan-associated protein
VADTTAPVIANLPLNINVQGDAVLGGVNTTHATIVAFLAKATATDLVDGNVTVSNNSVGLYATGSVTTITFTATDAAGNSSSFTRTLTINDPATVAASGTGLTIAQSIALGLDPNATTTDTDGDGISDAVEIGDPANPYDLDNDGVLDAFESGNLNQNQSIASGLPMDSGTVAISSTGQTLSNVSHTTATTTPQGVSFPFGILDYYTTTSVVGGTQTVRITHSTALPANLVLYKVDVNGVYSALPATAWTQVDAFSVDLTFTDGGQFDLDGVANGVIVDPVAIGVATASAVTQVSSGGFGGGCSLQASSGKFDPMLPLLMFISVLWLLKRRAHSAMTVRSIASTVAIVLSLALMTPTSSQANETSDAPWRVGAGGGAFLMSTTYPGDPSTYKKVLPGYVVNLGYMALPWLETGVLVSGGGKGTDTQAGNAVELKLPALPQVYARARQQIGGAWGVYEMLTLGSLRQEARNAANTVVLSDRVVAMGVGAGVSRSLNRNWMLDVGVFAPGIALAKRNSGLSTSQPGVLVALNYAFGGESEVPVVAQPEPVKIAPPAPKPVVKAKSKPVVKPVVKPVPKPIVLPKMIKLDGVNFESNSAKLDGASSTIVTKAAETLKKHPKVKVEVAAYTDSKGSESYNLKLSNKRAASVADYLKKLGVDAQRISNKGYGEANPIADNSNAEGRAKNRRVELHIQ